MAFSPVFSGDIHKSKDCILETVVSRDGNGKVCVYLKLMYFIIGHCESMF